MKLWRLLMLVICIMLLPVVGVAEYVFPAGEEVIDCGHFTLTLQEGDMYLLGEKSVGAVFCKVFPAYEEDEEMHANIGMQWINDGSLANITEEAMSTITMYTVMNTSQALQQMNMEVRFLSVEPMHQTEMFGTSCYALSYTMVLSGLEEAYGVGGEIECVAQQVMVPVNEQEYYIFSYGTYGDGDAEATQRVLSTLCWKEPGLLPAGE